MTLLSAALIQAHVYGDRETFALLHRLDAAQREVSAASMALDEHNRKRWASETIAPEVEALFRRAASEGFRMPWSGALVAEFRPLWDSELVLLRVVAEPNGLMSRVTMWADMMPTEKGLYFREVWGV